MVYFWSAVRTTSVNIITVTGQGFDVLTSRIYICRFSGFNLTTSVTISYFTTATNITTLSCGVTPGGFSVVAGVISANLTILEANLDLSDGTTILTSSGNISGAITFSSCNDRYKDGDETDVSAGVRAHLFWGVIGVDFRIIYFCVWYRFQYQVYILFLVFSFFYTKMRTT